MCSPGYRYTERSTRITRAHTARSNRQVNFKWWLFRLADGALGKAGAGAAIWTQCCPDPACLQRS